MVGTPRSWLISWSVASTRNSSEMVWPLETGALGGLGWLFALSRASDQVVWTGVLCHLRV